MAIAASKRAASCRRRSSCGVAPPRRHPATTGRALAAIARTRRAHHSTRAPVDRGRQQCGARQPKARRRSGRVSLRAVEPPTLERGGSGSSNAEATEAASARPVRARLRARSARGRVRAGARRAGAARSRGQPRRAPEWRADPERRRSTHGVVAGLADRKFGARREAGGNPVVPARLSHEPALLVAAPRNRHVGDPAPDENVPSCSGCDPCRLQRGSVERKRGGARPARDHDSCAVASCSGAAASSST